MLKLSLLAGVGALVLSLSAAHADEYVDMAAKAAAAATAHADKWTGPTTGPKIALVTAANIAFDGGPKNIFDPDNGYRDEYKKIWGVK